MARRMHRRSRRRRRVVWFAPRTSDTMNDPTVSCWSDVAAPLFPVGSASSPRILVSPIVTNIAQAVSPSTDADLGSHPLSERWTIQRIRGQVLVDVINTQQVPSALDGVVIHLGIVRMATVGDAFPIPQPQRNDSCLSDWMWLHHEQSSAAVTVCENCQSTLVTSGTIIDGSTTETVNLLSTGPTGTAITGYDVFGRPNLIDIDVDVRVKRKIEPEHGLWLVVTAEVAPTAVDRVELSVHPYLRVLLSGSV